MTDHIEFVFRPFEMKTQRRNSELIFRVGIDLAQHATSKLRDSQVEWADLILCMEGWQAKSVAAQWPSVRHKIRLLGDFLSGPPYSIGDPWGQSDEVFTATFERLAAATERIAQLLGRQQR